LFSNFYYADFPQLGQAGVEHARIRISGLGRCAKVQSLSLSSHKIRKDARRPGKSRSAIIGRPVSDPLTDFPRTAVRTFFSHFLALILQKYLEWTGVRLRLVISARTTRGGASRHKAFGE
jgi:hypothetical protein